MTLQIMGVFTFEFFIRSAGAVLISVVAGTMVGAAVYKKDEPHGCRFTISRL